MTIEDIINQLQLQEDSDQTDSYNEANFDMVEDFLTEDELLDQGIDDDDKMKQLPKHVEIEEELVHAKRFKHHHVHKYTESEMAVIREECKYSIVHDYGKYDIYHLSDEERIINDALADIAPKVNSLHRTYGKVDEYIEAMRIYVEAWKLLEKQNFVHSRKEFYQMVADGRIVSNRFTKPKLRKMNRYNEELILQYINDTSLDPKDLVENKKSDPIIDDYYKNFLDEDDEDYIDEEEQMRQYLSPEEAEFIRDCEERNGTFQVDSIPISWMKGYSERRWLNSKKKKLSKSERVTRENLYKVLNAVQDAEAMDSDARSRYLSNDIFETEKPDKDVLDDMRYNGSWADDEGVELYDIAINEELLDQHPAKETYTTYRDIVIRSLLRDIEAGGLSSLSLAQRIDASVTSAKVANEKKIRKEDKKIEAAIVDRISKLNKDPKFAKLIRKAEDAINNFYEDK